MRRRLFGHLTVAHAAFASSFALAFLAASPARATGILEFPDNGSEQMQRGGAWVARASDPLAAFYNPAGLAGQATRVTLQGNLTLQSRCFTRIKAIGDTTSADGAEPGGAYPQVCSEGGIFPNPQLAATYRVNDRIGVGLAVLGPSAVGASHWPEFGPDGRTPAPQRYMLVKTNVFFLMPTLGAGFEVADGVRLGASFQWGIASKIAFTNAAMAINQGASARDNDVKAQLDAKTFFVPGFTLGALISPTDNLDIGAWYKWSAPIDAKGDVTITEMYGRGNVSDSSKPDCGIRGRTDNPCGSGDNVHIKVPLPMEAKLGVRFHKPREEGTRRSHARDPLSQDVFDVEANFTWANNSAFDDIQVRFPSAVGNPEIGRIPVASVGSLPPNADIHHGYKDVFGVRLGGDYNLLRDKLAVRAGGFFETRAQNDRDQNIDFIGAQKIGFALGGTYRLRLGGEPKTNALEFSLGYGHVFVGTQSNTDPNAPGLHALAGTQCNPASSEPGPNCPSGLQKYRSNWPINLGTITTSINVINVGVAYRF